MQEYISLKYIIILFLSLFFINIVIAEDQTPPDTARSAVFAAGCFWCIEKDFERHRGVYAVYAGYSGGSVVDPTYKQVSAGQTGHREVVQVWYDPEQLSYADLLDIFWRNVDPFNDRGQFCDKGHQYTSAVYFDSPEEAEIAMTSKEALSQRFNRRIMTSIEPAKPFYLAEDYHQNYYLKSPLRYRGYRYSCGRDQRLDDIWGNEARAEFKPTLIK